MLFGPIVRRTIDASQGLSAGVTGGKARRTETEIETLKAEIERLLLITESLWEILKEKHGYTDDELIRRIGEIDYRDGKLDGRVQGAPPELCPHCQRTLIKKRPFCMYCGKPVAANPFQR